MARVGGQEKRTFSAPAVALNHLIAKIAQSTLDPWAVIGTNRRFLEVAQKHLATKRIFTEWHLFSPGSRGTSKYF